jgi:hypothetical protein
VTRSSSIIFCNSVESCFMLVVRAFASLFCSSFRCFVVSVCVKEFPPYQR